MVHRGSESFYFNLKAKELVSKCFLFTTKRKIIPIAHDNFISQWSQNGEAELDSKVIWTRKWGLWLDMQKKELFALKTLY